MKSRFNGKESNVEGHSHVDESHDGLEGEPHGSRYRKALLLCSGIAMAVALLLHLTGISLAAEVIGMVAGTLGTIYMLPELMRDVRRGRFSMNSLTVIATVAGIAVGEPIEAGMVIFLYEVGEMLEDWARDRASDTLSEMEGMIPAKAHVVMHDGEVIDMPTEGIEAGETVRVLAGERVPTDGVVTKGTSEFDESHISGESVPVPHGESLHPEVVGGALNVGPVVEIRVTAPSGESAVSRIADMTRKAREGRIPHQSMLDAFAERYTPIVGVVACVVAFVVPATMSMLGMPSDWLEWVRRGVSLLVIGCPCSVVIGMPVTFVSGIHALARNGIVVSGGEIIETAANTQRIMLDKTGTITTGRMSVEMEVSRNGNMRNEALAAALAIESASNHPIAKAVVSYANAQMVGTQTDVAVWNVHEVPGMGMSGKVDGHEVTVGRAVRERIDQDDEVASSLAQVADEMASAGLTPIEVSIDGVPTMTLGIGNEVRDGAEEAIARMGSLTGESPTMLTGDSLPVARAIANEVGIGEDDVRAGMFPEQKMEAVLSSQVEGKVTMMVGDGINDAPALAHADVGVAVGDSKSDISFGMADAIAMGDPLDAACALVSISRRIMATARLCLVLSIVAKLIAAILVMTGAMGMGIAVMADTGMTLAVSLIGLGASKMEARR